MVATAPLFPVTANDPLPLRPYQRECLDAIHHERHENGITRQIACLPTGAGKTVVATWLAHEVQLPTVFIVHRDELVKQTVDKFAQSFPAFSLAVCKADQGRTVRELRADIVVASAQTLARRERLDTLVEAIGTRGLLISDEAHHDRAATRMAAIEALDPELLVGLTATPSRGDGKGLGAVYEKIVFQMFLSELVQMDMLARPVGIRIGTGVDINGVGSGYGENGKDFVQSQLQTVVNTPERNELVYEAWLKHAKTAGRTRTVAFCVDIAHVQALTETFNSHGVRAHAITGKTPEAERARSYRLFREGDVEVLVNCMVLTEGWDEPRADCALMCRPTQSQALYIQMAGRVLRKWPGKPDALIVDFVDLFDRHNLQTVTTLVDDSEEPVSEEDRKDGELFDPIEAASRKNERKAKIRRGAERVSDLISGSTYTWVEAKGGKGGPKYLVGLGDGQFIACVPAGEPGSGLFLPVMLNTPRGQAPTFRPLFGRPVDAETAMGIANQQVPPSPITTRDVAWRQRPASTKQVELMQRFRVRIPGDRWITAGEAADAIDRAFFEANYAKAGLDRLVTTNGGHK